MVMQAEGEVVQLHEATGRSRDLRTLYEDEHPSLYSRRIGFAGTATPVRGTRASRCLRPEARPGFPSRRVLLERLDVRVVHGEEYGLVIQNVGTLCTSEPNDARTDRAAAASPGGTLISKALIVASSMSCGFALPPRSRRT